MDTSTAQIVAAVLIVLMCAAVDWGKRARDRAAWVSRNTTAVKSGAKWEQIAPMEECFDQLDDL